jgi:glutathione S-transferase
MSARFSLHGLWLSGPTYKVGLYLSLAGEPFDYAHVDLLAGAHKDPDYLAKQRYGQVPLLVDRQNGRHLIQSASILEYLADTLGRFGGANLDERIAAREWMYWDFDRLARGVYLPRLARAGFLPVASEVLDYFSAEGRAALGVLDGHLAGRGWMVGEGVTIADIDLYGVVAYAGPAGHDLAGMPNLSAWASRMAGLPGFLGPEDCLPKESRAA